MGDIACTRRLRSRLEEYWSAKIAITQDDGAVVLCLFATIAVISFAAIAGVVPAQIDPIVSDSLSKGKLIEPSHYTEVIHVHGVPNCRQVCSDLELCVAFTIVGLNKACMFTTECDTIERRAGYRTYSKPHDNGEHRVLIDENDMHKEMQELDDKAEKGARAANLVVEKEMESLPRGRRRMGNDICSHCPPQNPCEEPRMCRNGKCFNGLLLPTGIACDCSDSIKGITSARCVCMKGECTPVQ